MSSEALSPASSPSTDRVVVDLAPRSRRLGPTPEGYLASTPWCDADHATVRELAAALTRRATSSREAAVALFHWVRDEVAYTMGDWNRRASETLALRIGTCSNKANLLVALARAVGIPAGFHVQYIRTDDYFGGGFIPTVQRIVRGTAIHVYVSLFLDGGWVKCDPTDDRALCESIRAIVPHAQVLAFDGVHHAELPFRPGAVQSDAGPFAEIDGQLARPPRISPACKKMFGAFIVYMRANGARYTERSDGEKLRIDRDFRAWFAGVDPEGHADLCREEQNVVRAAA